MVMSWAISDSLRLRGASYGEAEGAGEVSGLKVVSIALGSCGVGAGAGFGRGAVLSFQMAMVRASSGTRGI